MKDMKMIFFDNFNYHNSNIIIIITNFLHLIWVNNQKYIKMFKRFLFSYLFYGNKILLNLHMEDYHFVFFSTQTKEWKIAIFSLFIWNTTMDLISQVVGNPMTSSLTKGLQEFQILSIGFELWTNVDQLLSFDPIINLFINNVLANYWFFK
jgi:hypothetical protein